MNELDRFLSQPPADDWTLLAFLLLFLLSCLTFGPLLGQLKTSFVYVYKIRNSNAEFKTLILSPLRNFVAVAVSILSISFASALSGLIPERQGTHALVAVLHAFIYILPCFLARQLLFRTVNARLYASQKINVKPLRWNALNITMLSFMGIVSLIVGLMELFIPFPPVIYVILLLFFAMMCIYGEIIKAKSSLFSSRCKLLGIILYLCALEIGPLVLALFLLGTNIIFL